MSAPTAPFSPPARRHGALASSLRSVLTHPLARGLDLDSADATAVHRRLIREACDIVHRRAAPVHAGVVIAQPQRRGVGEAARLRHLLRAD